MQYSNKIEWDITKMLENQVIRRNILLKIPSVGVWEKRRSVLRELCARDFGANEDARGEFPAEVQHAGGCARTGKHILSN